MERDSAIKPYEYEIEKNNEEIEILELALAKAFTETDNGYIIVTGGLEKEQQKTLREENKKLEMKIQDMQAIFQKDIDEFKKNPY